MSYADDLKHPKWQEKRLRVLEHAGFRCERCHTNDRQLHAHHKVYLKGHKPWEYEDRLLECVCDDCHALAHEEREQLDLIVAGMPTAMVPQIADVAAVVSRGGDEALPPINPTMLMFAQRLSKALNERSPRAWSDVRNTLQDIADEQLDLLRGPGGA